jgi:TRAP-type mannitol/chloroaromatic compound transport system permease small subunit
VGGLLRIARIIDAITEQINKANEWIVLAVIIVGFLNALGGLIGQYVGMKLSSQALIELQWQGFSLLFFLGFPYILKHNINVRVDFLYAKWNERRKAMVDFWGTILFLIPFCLIAIYITYNPLLKSWGLRANGTWGKWQTSGHADGLFVGPIKTVTMIAFAILLFQAIAQAIKYFAVMRGHKDIAKEISAQTESME